jgi:hypothetical protein
MCNRMPPLRVFMAERAQEVAGQLLGTPHNLTYAASAAEMSDKTFCQELDSLVFECIGCGWWCDVEELHDTDEGQKCNDCVGE